MRILGVDYGLSKIGLAIGEEFLSQPLGIIATKDWQKKIPQICLEQQIEKIVVGYSQGKLSKLQENFAQKLSSITSLPVDLQDETLTTHEAFVRMKEVGKRTKDDDAFAAALILEAYFEKQNV